VSAHTSLNIGALTDAQLHRLLMALGGLLGGRQDRATAQKEIDTLAAEQVGPLNEPWAWPHMHYTCSAGHRWVVFTQLAFPREVVCPFCPRKMTVEELGELARAVGLLAL
jgi:hypothetical protein